MGSGSHETKVTRMKKYILTALLAGMLASSFAQAKKDSVAIINLLEKEAATWRSGDIKAHADCWYIRPYSRILISTIDNGVIDAPISFIVNPSADMVGKGGKAIISNVKMGITGKAAWVSHNEESISSDGKSTFTYEVRLLEKINRKWRLVGQSVHAYKK
jgi:hypothetical protein